MNIQSTLNNYKTRHEYMTTEQQCALYLNNSRRLDPSAPSPTQAALPLCGLSEDLALDLGPVIVFPGLINSHTHLEFDAYPTIDGGPFRDYRAWARHVHHHYGELIEKIEAIPLAYRRQWGAFKNLLCGVTQIVDHCATPDAAAEHTPATLIDDFRFIHAEDSKWARLKLFCPSGDRPVVVHIGEGVTPEKEHQTDRFLAANIFRNPVIGVHGIAASDLSLTRLRALVWCPVSNLHLYNQTLKPEILNSDIPILFGTDSNLSAAGHLFDHLRTAHAKTGQGGANLLKSLTSTPSAVWRVNNIPALQDYVVARQHYTDPVKSFLALNPEDILIVIKAGKLLLLDECAFSLLKTDTRHPLTAAIQVGGRLKYVALKTPDLLTCLMDTEAGQRLKEMKLHAVSPESIPEAR